MKIIKINAISLVLLLAINICSSCSIYDKREFVDSVKTVKTDNHKRLLGSRVYLDYQNDFTYLKNLSRIQKTDNQYLMVIESPQSYFDVQESIYNQFLQLASSDNSVTKRIKVNGKDAIYAEGYSEKRGGNLITLVMGNENSYVMIFAKHDKGNITQRNELIEILETVYFDDKFELDPLELADFEFSHEKTGLVLRHSASNMFFYARPSADIQTTEITAVLLQVMPAMSEVKGKEYLLDLIRRYEEKGSIYDNKLINSKTVRSQNTIYLTSNVSKGGNLMYQYISIFLGADKSLVYLCTAINDDIEVYKDKFIESEKTIKLN